MKRSDVIVLTILFAASAAWGAEEKARPPVKAKYSVELPGLAGEVSPLHTSGKEYPAPNVVKLSLKSDGKRITVAATLKAPPSDFATGVLRLELDTDNDAATGAQFTFPKIGGFEYQAELDACVSYADRSEACTGGSNAKATGHWAAIELERFKGKEQFDLDPVVSSMGFSGRKASPRTPITGASMESSIGYDDLHVKSGQTIRIIAKDQHRSSSEHGGYFPDVLLTLK